MSKIKLNACPHCGKATVQIVSCRDGLCRLEWKEKCDTCLYFGYRAECVMRLGGCGATSGKRATPESAAEAWNSFKPGYVIGQTVWYLRRSGGKRPTYDVKMGVLSEIGYTGDMRLAGSVKYGAKGVIGEVIFATEKEAVAERNRLNGKT